MYYIPQQILDSPLNSKNTEQMKRVIKNYWKSLYVPKVLDCVFEVGL
jgi:hypothetical protein